MTSTPTPEPSEAPGPYSIGSSTWPGTSKVIEECGELMEVAGKLMGSGGNTAHWTGDLRSRLLEELADASSAIHFFAQANLTGDEYNAFLARSGVKGNRFWRWHVENGGFTRRFEHSEERCLCGGELLKASYPHHALCSAATFMKAARPVPQTAVTPAALRARAQDGGKHG